MNLFIHIVLCILGSLECVICIAYYDERYIVQLKPSNESKLRDNSYFGYSVTYEATSKKFIVSAPNADIVGKVFECDVKNATCEENTPPIEKVPNTSETNGYWTGATVKAGKSIYVVCAPRYANGVLLWWKRSIDDVVYGTVGVCYANTNNTWVKMKMLDGDNVTTYAMGVDDKQDSVGWSISISEKNSILVGGPAMNSGRAVLYKTINAAPKIYRGFQVNHNTDTLNFGYSVLLEKVNNVEQLIVSTPFDISGKGKVLSINNPLLSVSRKTDIFSSMYGASICILKCNKNKELLVVGAPTLRDTSTNSYDTGGVIVYDLSTNQKHRNGPVPVASFYGHKDRAYFGIHVVNIGDINGDGSEDVAISAPYEDNGRGAVYIYSGFELANKKKKKIIQKIQYEGYQYMGVGLTAMSDLDDNGCSALGIGAPGSGNALVLHCIAAVTCILKVEEFPDLQNRKKSPTSKVNETHFFIDWCLNYKFAEKPKNIELDLLVTVKLEHEDAKLIAIDGSNLTNGDAIYNITQRDKKNICKQTLVYLPLNGTHYKKAINLLITVVQMNSSKVETKFNPARVKLSDTSVLRFRPEPLWAAECDKQGPCTPWLIFTVNTTLRDKYVIGSTDEETIDISVTNVGDIAYRSCVRIEVHGVKIKQAPSCEHNTDNINELICKTFGPLRNEPWNLGNITLDMSTLNSKDKKISYMVSVQNDCVTTSDSMKKEFNLINDEDGIIINGKDNFGGSVAIPDDNEKTVVHIYKITNNGTTNWVDLRFYMKIPKETYIKSTPVWNLTESDDAYTSSCNMSSSTYWIDVSCGVDTLARSQTILMFLNTTVDPTDLENGNITFESSFSLKLDTVKKLKHVRTTLRIVKPKIPLWIIIAGIVLAILVLLILAVIMYEMGFFKRTAKEQLRNLRTSVHRQSMRQSTCAAHSSRNNLINEETIILDDEICVS